MLQDIETLNTDTRVLLVYVKSPILKTIIKDKIKQRLQIGKYTTIEVKTASKLKEARQETAVSPFYGGQWLIEVEAPQIGLKELLGEIDNINNTSVTVYWTDDYRMFKAINSSKKVEKLRGFYSGFYFGKLDPEDIWEVEKHIVKDENMHLTREMMVYLEKNYTYDVDKVCNLFMLTKAGERVNKTQDIIRLVGLGGNTVDNFVIKLLTANPKTDKGNAKTLKTMMGILEDLSVETDINSISNFMKYTVKTIYQIKELQILGYYTAERKEIPEGYNEKKIKVLKRFDWVVLEQINMARVLNLDKCLNKYRGYNTKEDLIKGIMEYLSMIQYMNELNPESEEIQYRR